VSSTPSVVAVVRAFTEAVNAQAYGEASALLAIDVELLFPGGVRLQGREAWLESRRRQQPGEQLSEHVEADALTRTAGRAELSGRLVQRWVETGEAADELPVRISFAVEGGLITRLELAPG